MSKQAAGTKYFRQRKHGPAPGAPKPRHCRCGAFVHHGGPCVRCTRQWLGALVVLFLLLGLYVRVVA